MSVKQAKPEELSPRQTAWELHYALGYVYALLYSGQFDGARKVDGQWRIPTEAVEARRQQRQGRKNSLAKRDRVLTSTG